MEVEKTMESNPIESFIAYLEKNHQYINQVYIFFAVISVVLVFLFEGFIPAIVSGFFTFIGALIALWIINWLNTSNQGKYHLFGWILVGMSIYGSVSYIINHFTAKPVQAATEKTVQAFRNFQRS
jgi:ABC-type Fe3+-siderophore transport system permease subunit